MQSTLVTMCYGHVKYFAGLISQQTYYSTTDKPSCSNKGSPNITGIFQADFLFSFDDIFITVWCCANLVVNSQSTKLLVFLKYVSILVF